MPNHHTLIHALVDDLKPQPPLKLTALLIKALPPLILAGLLLIAILLGLRTDWPVTAFAKLALFGSLFLYGVSQLHNTASPAIEKNRWQILALAKLAFAAAVLFMHAEIIPITAVFSGTSFMVCTSFIVLGGMVIWLTLRHVLRAARPAVTPRLFGALLGGSSGALTAAIYATHCPMDSPSYLVLVYLPPILFLALLGGCFPHVKWRW